MPSEVEIHDAAVTNIDSRQTRCKTHATQRDATSNRAHIHTQQSAALLEVYVSQPVAMVEEE
jgi:hypothetical protein